MKKAGAPVKVLIENITTLGAPADDQSKIHAATEPAPLQNGVKQSPATRPSSCPHCGGVTFQRHGWVSKAVKDPYVSEVSVLRYRCTDCLRTFRHYPEGVDSHDQSMRLRGLAALVWGLGLSHRSVSDLLKALGCDLSRMSSWRDVQKAGYGAAGMDLILAS